MVSPETLEYDVASEHIKRIRVIVVFIEVDFYSCSSCMALQSEPCDNSIHSRSNHNSICCGIENEKRSCASGLSVPC